MLRVALIGAGRGGSALLPILLGYKDLRLIGIAEINPKAPGLAIARRLEIPITRDFRKLLDQPDLDVVIDVTRNPAVAKQLKRLKRPGLEIIGGLSAKLFWDLIQDRDRKAAELQTLNSSLEQKEGLLHQIHVLVSQGRRRL